MMSLRYHLVSLVAVLLALALGVVLGASALSGRMVGAMSTDRNELAARTQQLEADQAAQKARVDATERVVADHADATVRDALAGRTVALVTTPDADPADVAALTDLVSRSGAQVTGRLDLTDAVTAPDRADALRALVPRLLPAGAQLPPTTDTGTLTGSLLGALVTTRPGDRTVRADGQDALTALSALTDAGYVRAPGPAEGSSFAALGVPQAPVPAELALVVTGSGAAPGRDTTLVRLVDALDRSAVGAVLAGRAGSGPVTAARADPAARSAMSTVDTVDAPSARVATVFALSEQTEGRAAAAGPASQPPSP